MNNTDQILMLLLVAILSVLLGIELGRTLGQTQACASIDQHWVKDRCVVAKPL